jgi:hypothetical protein
MTDWPKLDPIALHGLARDVVHAIEPYTEADPAALLTGYLAAVGSACGSGPHARVGSAQHPARLFVAVVGATARGRKGTAATEIIPVVDRADAGWRERVRGGFGSGEALVEDLAESADKRLLVREKELARVLAVASRETSILSPILRGAWDDGTLEVRTRKNTAIAHGTHVSVLGDITVEELRRALTATETVNGFANRFLFVAARRPHRLPRGDVVPDRVLAPLVKRTAERVVGCRGFGVMRRTDAAEERWAELYNAIDDDVDGLLGAATARAEAQMLRLQVAYALLDGSRAIDLEHVNAAEALWHYCEDTARMVFGAALGDPDADLLLAALRAVGDEGLTGVQQDRVFHGRSDRLLRSRAVLLDRGLAVQETRQTAGRPEVRLWATRMADLEDQAD